MEGQKITLYVGLNDKDTKKQKIRTGKALKVINKILLQYVDGATVYLSNGIYKHINGQQTLERSVVVILYDTTQDIISKIIITLCKALNQEAILQENATVNTYYKYGTDADTEGMEVQ